MTKIGASPADGLIGWPGTSGGAMRSGNGYEHAVRMEGIRMAFGNVVALRAIHLTVGRDEILGLIGDNGAGKSTLIKIMTGALRPTGGRLWIRDQEIAFDQWSVRQAHALGIETVYLEKSLGEKQPLWRNFFVGRQITNRFGFIDVKREKAIADQILKEEIGFRGVGIGADSPVAKLSGGERQGVAIGRAMHFEKDLIVLDEPTVALAIKEVQKVLDFVRDIKKRGRACVYIEHNLAHVHELADRLVILDRGAIVAEFRQGEISLTDLTGYLIDLQQTKREGVAPATSLRGTGLGS
jgi:simple sugar transport system ATP-binding protein